MEALSMTFGEFIRNRREELKLTPDDFPDLSRSYITVIETNAQRPRKQDTVKTLYDKLLISQTGKSFEWFWVYALLNKNPDLIFGGYGTLKDPTILAIVRQLEQMPEEMRKFFAQFLKVAPQSRALEMFKSIIVSEEQTEYHNNAEVKIGSTEADVLSILGQPEKKLSLPHKSKWIYNEDIGARIVFTSGKVIDVEF